MESKREYNRRNYKDMVGIYRDMNCGIRAKIIEYTSYGNILIEFEDGYITKTRCKNFENGTIRNPNVQSSYTSNRVGEEKIMSNGQSSKIIRYGYCDDIDIQFEDGTIKTTTYGRFSSGHVENPNINNSPTKYRVGYVKKNKQGILMKIVEYLNCDNIVVEFQDEHLTRINTTYGHFKIGDITNPYYKNKFGVGCLGFAEAMDGNGKFKKSYKYWSNMMRRCYFDTTNCYKDVFVCDEWLIYENFEKWFDNNYNDIPFKVCLDKDILSYNKGINKIYSPNTCAFIPSEINTVFRPNVVGIFHDKWDKYQVRLGKNYFGKYDTYKQALKKYNEEKIKYYKSLAIKYKEYIQKEVYETLVNYEGEKE